jgi:hypothetical protein
MSHTGAAERRNIYLPDRVRTESRDSDSPTVVQTHFRIGKDYPSPGRMLKKSVSRRKVEVQAKVEQR